MAEGGCLLVIVQEGYEAFVGCNGQHTGRWALIEKAQAYFPKVECVYGKNRVHIGICGSWSSVRPKP